MPELRMSIMEKNRNDLEISTEIDRVERISPDEFRQKYILGNRPLVMTGMMNDWGAMKKWNLEFFHQLASNQQVLLEEGNVMQEQTGFRRQSFKEFIEKLMQSELGQERVAYLSVYRIFEQFPQLRSDVDFSLLDQFKMKSSTSGWIGPAGTVTGYHIDWGDNILAQVLGRKQLHLVAPSDTPNMYVSKKFDQGTTISQVDFENYDEARYPKYRSVRHHKIILHPGECVFIPRGWWHHVRSLDTSISVSNIGFDLRGIMFDVVPHRIKQAIHDAGLWKCECTCHVMKEGKWHRK